MGASSLARLSEQFLDAQASADPFVASLFGVPGYDDRVPDLSESGQLAAAERLLDLASQAEEIPVDSLSADDGVTRAVLVHAARADASILVDRHTEFCVSGHASPVAVVFSALAYTRLDGPAGERDYLSRVRGIPGYLADHRQRVLDGVASGRVPTRRGVEQTIERVSAYLSTSLDDDLVLAPARGTAIEEAVGSLVTDAVRPAFANLLETLSGPLLPATRPDGKSGLLHLPDGQEMYARAVASHTTTTRSPEEIHQLGLDLCAALRAEYAELGQKVFGTSDFDAIVDRLRHDPGLRYENAQQLLDDARAALTRAEDAIGAWFGHTPKARCIVEPMDPVVAPAAVIGEYLPPATDGSRPGRYNINTYQPHTRTRYEYETLAFHESVPGHHLQFALAQEVDGLPAFRKTLYVTAFGEGWGLYTERLADEIGLYTSDLARFGMLSFDSWRACRLVVDTGMHHYGWSRQRAIEFMLANSAATRENVVNEVDRYIAWPGQALAYMCGRIEIEALRDKARERLGSAFDIRAFHDAVLGNGSVPLAVLAAEVDRWIAEQVQVER